MIEFTLTIFYFIIFCLIISKITFFNDKEISKHWFIVVFGFKVILSIILTSIYTNYYTNRETADIFKYFDDSKVMFDALKTNPIDYFKMLFGIDNDSSYFNINYYNNMEHWYRFYNSNLFSDSHTIIRFNALIRLFSFGYFQVHNVFINFIALIGLTAIYKAFKPYFLNFKKPLFYVIFLIPSVAFWGSGLLKEGILFFALGLFVLHFFKLCNSFSLKSIVIIGGTIILILYTKLYILIALIPAMIGYLLYLKLFKGKALLSYSISFISILLLSLFLNVTSSKYDPFKQLINKQADFIHLISNPDIDAKSIVYIPIIKDNIDVLKSIPHALSNTILRPFLWEVTSPFILLNALENLLLMLLLIIAFLFRTKKITHKNQFYFCLAFVFTLFAIVGITTPVLGAIVRYKIPGLPFLLIALLFIIDLEKLKLKYSILKKIL